MRNEELFSKQAPTYAQFRPTYPQALFADLAALVNQRSTAWDCATGNGQSARSLALFFEKVIATDANPKQIRETVAQDKVFYVLSQAEKSGLASQSIDLVTVSQAIHWFDLDPFYGEIRRIVKTGGILAAWGYEKILVNAEVNPIFNRLLDDITGPYWSPRRQLINDHYRTLPFPFAEIPMPTYRIEVNLTLAHLKGYADSWSATQKFIESRGYNPWKEIEKEVADAWGDPAASHPAHWPIFIRAGRLPE